MASAFLTRPYVKESNQFRFSRSLNFIQAVVLGIVLGSIVSTIMGFAFWVIWAYLTMEIT